MRPILFQIPEGFPIIGGAEVQSFGILLFFSFIAAGVVARHELNRLGEDGERMSDLVFWALVGGIVGGKLYFVLANPPQSGGRGLSALFSGTGFTWYGGFILATLMVWIYMRRTRLPVGKTFDAIAMGMPIGILVGRFGCFLAGDDYGRPTGSWAGVAFPEGAPPTTVTVLRDRFGVEIDPALVARFGEVIPVHPTQLYEMVTSLVIFVLLLRLRHVPHRPGWMFGAWMGLYAVNRFLLEIVRLKSDRFLFGTFTQAQVISAVLLGVSVWMVTQLRARPGATGGTARAA
ncbi:MAG: prolipoprotein diacylglyceryl transferase [Gemmatimonadota bacterium]